jgi:hypothetical protein
MISLLLPCNWMKIGKIDVQSLVQNSTFDIMRITELRGHNLNFINSPAGSAPSILVHPASRQCGSDRPCGDQVTTRLLMQLRPCRRSSIPTRSTSMHAPLLAPLAGEISLCVSKGRMRCGADKSFATFPKVKPLRHRSARPLIRPPLPRRPPSPAGGEGRHGLALNAPCENPG